MSIVFVYMMAIEVAVARLRSNTVGMNQVLAPLCQQYHAYSTFQQRLEQAGEPCTAHTRCLLSLATLYSHNGGHSYAPERPHPVYGAQYVQILCLATATLL